ncbi:MAG: hypothetical protein M1550_06025 [Deltaproteobacteria bacterium]|nr:hypothetical protein [Deltaproteobacteria bacterium]
MLNPDFRDILSAFNEERVEFLLVGAYALAVHGIPRATGDIDLWIHRSEDNSRRVWQALANFGAPLAGRTAEELQTPDVVFQVGVPPNRIDILTSLDGVAFDEAWPARTEVIIDGIRVPVIGRGHFIRNKKAVGRPQDLADVARLESGE